MRLKESEIKKSMKGLKGWKFSGNKITRKIKFENFMEGFHFIQDVVQHAEKMKHHPDVFLCYGEVTFFLTTHDEGGVTQKDIELAAKINEILGEEK